MAQVGRRPGSLSAGAAPYPAGLEARAYSRGWATGGAETERLPLSPVGPGA